MTIDKMIKPHRAWFIFILVALFLVYEMALQVYPAVITEQLMRDLHINAFGLGLMSGIYFYTYTLMQIPAGLLFDRYPIRTIIILPLTVCIIGAFLFSIAQSALIASAARLLMGAGSAFAFISVLVVANDLFPPKHFAFLTGTAQMLAACGAIAGGLPLVSFIHSYGWRSPLMFISMIGLLLIVSIGIFVHYQKSYQTNIQEEKLRVRDSLKLIYRNPQTWFIALYACLLWAPMSAFASLWGVPFLTSYHGLTKAAAVNANSLMWVGIALGSPLLGWWSDHIGRRCLPLSLAAFMGFIGLSTVIFIPKLPFFTIAVSLFLAGAACSGQALSFAIVRENNNSRTHAAAIGFNNMAVVIAGALFQPLVGKLIQLHASGTIENGLPLYTARDYWLGTSILPGCFLVGTLLACYFIKETYCQNNHQLTN